MSQSHGPISWKENVRKDAASAALAGVYVGILGPFIGLVAAKTLHASVFLIAIIVAAPFIGNMLTPLWVHWMHGKPKIPFVVIPGAAARSLYLLMLLVRSAPEYAGVVFLANVFEASSGPGYSAVMERIYPRKLRGRIMSGVRVARTLVVIGITLVAGRVLDHWGYHEVFAAAGICGLAASFIFSRMRAPGDRDELERQRPQAKRGDAWRIFRSDHAYRRFALAIFVYGLGNLLISPIYPLFVSHTLRITYAEQGILSFVSSVAALAGFLFWGRFIDRRGSVRCVFTCIGLVAIKPLIYFFAPNYIWLIPAAVIDGASSAGIEIGYINSILSFSPPEMVPAYQSLHASMLGIRGVAAPLLAGLLVTLLQAHHLGFRPAFIVSAAIILTGLVMGRRTRWRA